MSAVLEFFPIGLFFIVYQWTDIYTATATLMVTVVLQSLYLWFRHGRIPSAQLLTMGALLLFGGATLFFRDPRFIQWKPTIVYWLLALIFLGSHAIGDRVIIQRIMAKHLALPTNLWHALNKAWILYFIVSGTLNLYVAKQFDENTWVQFKLFGLMGLMILFLVAQSLYLSRYINDAPPDDGQPKKH